MLRQLERRRLRTARRPPGLGRPAELEGGDPQIRPIHTAAMVAHVDRVATLLSPTGLWDTGFQFGDWLDPDAPPEAPADAKEFDGQPGKLELFSPDPGEGD